MNERNAPGAAEGKPESYMSVALSANQRIAELEARLAEANARADIWERNYTQSETMTMRAARLRAEQAEAERDRFGTLLEKALPLVKADASIRTSVFAADDPWVREACSLADEISAALETKENPNER